MTIESTVIPSRIDVSATDESYVSVNDDEKLTLGNTYFSEYGELQLDIIELQANAEVTPINHDTIISDAFSDANGYNNTVVVESTSAYFSETTYINYDGEQVDAHDITLATNWGVTSDDVGMRIVVNIPCTLSEVTKDSLCTATRAILKQENGTVIDTQSFDGDVATFDQLLNGSGTEYRIELDNDASTFQGRYNATGAPHSGVYITWAAPSVNGADYGTPDFVINIVSLKLTAESGTKIIDVDLGEITGTVTDTMLVVNQTEGTPVTYKLKNATQEDDALTVNTKNALSNLTSNPTGIEIQLPPDAVIKSYALKIWKS
jgi:hypothetical protein